MAAKDTVRVFICHAWKHGGDYGRVVQLLYDLPFLHWENYSNPKDSGGFFSMKSSRKKKITEQIHPVDVVVMISDMYVTDHEWVKYELNEAVRMRKHIILVEPKLESDPIPQTLLQNADIVVPWHEYKLGNAVKSYALR